MEVVGQLVAVLKSQRTCDESIGLASDDVKRHQRCFSRAVERLTEAGIHTRMDRYAAAADYARHRNHWERELAAVSRFLGYTWGEISGDHDLSKAVEEAEDALGLPTSSL